MNILIIGGSSQDAYFLSDLHLNNGDKVYATFRNSDSAEWRQAQLAQVNNRMDLYHPLVGFPDRVSDISQYLANTRIDCIYYLSAINLPNGSAIDGDVQALMRKVHITEPTRIAEAILLNTKTVGVFPLSSKMYSLKLDEDRLINPESEINPQGYYGETKAQFWEILKELRGHNHAILKAPILFNHESKLRFPRVGGSNFLISKLWRLILRGATIQEILNSDINFAAREDWLHAYDASRVLYQVASLGATPDLIISSGKGTSIYGLLIEYLEAKEDNESINFINRKLQPEEPKRSCLIGDNSLTSEFVGAIKTKAVLS